jgi:predicted transcriptional regulator
MQRIANLLGLLLTRDMIQKDKIATLTAAGYSTGEIAAMVGTTTHAVSQAVYESKKPKKAKRGPKRDVKH